MADFIALFKRYAAAYAILAALMYLFYSFRESIPAEHRLVAFFVFIVIIIIAAVALHILDKKYTHPPNAPGNSTVNYYKPRGKEIYNEDFYNHFEKLIEGATDQILMTGDGFGCDNEESVQKAKNYIDSYRKILDKGIKVLRVQIEAKSHKKWADLLGSLVDLYPDNFELFIIRDEFDESVKFSMATIDPDIVDMNSAMIMFTSDKYRGTKNKSLATFAFIVEKDKDYAMEIAKRVRYLANEKFSHKITSSEQVKQILCGKRG